MGDAMSTALKSAVSGVAPRAVHMYVYEEPDGAPEAEQSKAMSSDPSYTEPGSAHATAILSILSDTYTLTSIMAGSALSAETVNLYL